MANVWGLDLGRQAAHGLDLRLDLNLGVWGQKFNRRDCSTCTSRLNRHERTKREQGRDQWIEERGRRIVGYGLGLGFGLGLLGMGSGWALRGLFVGFLSRCQAMGFWALCLGSAYGAWMADAEQDR